MAGEGFDAGEGQVNLRTRIELPDGSEARGLLIKTVDGWVLQVHGDKGLGPGDEVGLPEARYFTVVDVRRRRLDDYVVTELAVQGPFLRALDGHSLGDGWPQEYWRSVAEQCEYDGFAHQVVRYLERLGELRTVDQLNLARGWTDSLSAEHLAAVTGQVGGALLNLKRIKAPEDLVEDVASLYRDLVDEISNRAEQGEYLQPPNPATLVRMGRHQPDDWREVGDWSDLIL